MAYFGSRSALVETLPQGDITPYQYNKPKSGLNVCRMKRILNSLEQTYTSGQNAICRFRLPTDVPIDFRNSYVLADITLNVTGGTYKRLSNGVWNILDRVRHHANNDTIEERTSYNRIYSLLWQTLQDPDVEQTIGTDLIGIGTQADRDAAGAVTTRYCLPLDLGFLNSGVIPLHAFKGVCHEIELYLGRAESYVETDGTPISITVTNLEWHVETVTSMDGSYEESLRTLVDRSEFAVWYYQWATFQNYIANTQQDLIIAARNESLNAIISTFLPLSTMFSPTVNDKFNTFAKNDTTSYQYKINMKLIPEEPVDCTGKAIEAYMNYLTWAGCWNLTSFHANSPNITLSNFNADQFIIVADFRNTRGADVLNNFSTESSTLDLILKLNLSTAPMANLALMSYLNFNTVARVLPSGKVLVRS